MAILIVSLRSFFLLHLNRVNHTFFMELLISAYNIMVYQHTTNTAYAMLSPGLLDNNPEQIRNKLKYFSICSWNNIEKTYQKSSKIRLVLVPEIGVLRGR